MLNSGIIATGPLTQGNDGLTAASRAVLRFKHNQYVVHDQIIDDKLQVSLANGSYFPTSSNDAFQRAIQEFQRRITRDAEFQQAPAERYNVVIIPDDMKSYVVYETDKDDEGCVRLHVNTDLPYNEENCINAINVLENINRM